jgi:acetate kinase
MNLMKTMIGELVWLSRYSVTVARKIHRRIYRCFMNGADAVVFTGGIGENSSEVRARICEGLEWYGHRMDDDRNRAHVGGREA